MFAALKQEIDEGFDNAIKDSYDMNEFGETPFKTIAARNAWRVYHKQVERLVLALGNVVARDNLLKNGQATFTLEASHDQDVREARIVLEEIGEEIK